MILPKALFQKLLDGEISTDRYENILATDTLRRFAIFTAINIASLFLIAKYWTDTGGWKMSLWTGFLVITAVYMALAAFFGYYFYQEEKEKNSLFILAMEKDLQNEKKDQKTFSQSPASQNFMGKKFLIPRTAAKLLLKGEISKLQYLRSFFEFLLYFTRGLFILFSGVALVLFWNLNADIFTKIAASYFVGFAGTFLSRLKLTDIYIAQLQLTLEQKKRQEEAFHHAQNIAR